MSLITKRQIQYSSLKDIFLNSCEKEKDHSNNSDKKEERYHSKNKKPKKDPYFKRPHLLDQNYEESFVKQRKIFQEVKNLIENTPYDNKLKVIKNELNFVRSFNSKGVQANVGFVKMNKTNSPLVFKISTDINRSIEHEFTILENFNNMRKYCPHFVKSIGMIELPISSEFIFDCYNNNLFDDKDDETLPRNIMFMEYVNKLPFYRICQDSENKNIVISQILQVLLALEICQLKKNFTHYDLHTSNILIQMCDKNSLFIYKINGNTHIVPTYGFFPLIIDTGISYAKCTEGKQMMSNTDNYDHGFQTTVYDRLNDIHHFLLTTFYYIEIDSDGYDSLSNKIKIIFRHLPVLRKSGWKNLPNDLCDLIISKLKDDCRAYRKFELFDEYDKASLEILNGLIKLPIKHHGYNNKDFSDCFTAFMEEYHNLIDIDDFTEHDVLYVLRTIVDNINLYRDSYSSSDKLYIVDKFKNNFINTISTVLKNNVEYNINYEKLLVSGIVLSERLETNYYEMIEENKNIINELYEKTIVKSPIDMFRYISRNMTPHFDIDKNTLIYFWDADNETKNEKKCTNLSLNIINKINKSYFIDKGSIIINELKLNE
jgi:hypothetical protein